MTGRNKVGYFTKLDPKLREALRRYKNAVGVPEAVQIDRALRDWLGKRPDSGLEPTPKTTRKSSNRRKP
jgi:hypothetical protein